MFQMQQKLKEKIEKDRELPCEYVITLDRFIIYIYTAVHTRVRMQNDERD